MREGEHPEMCCFRLLGINDLYRGFLCQHVRTKGKKEVIAQAQEKVLKTVDSSGELENYGGGLVQMYFLY